MANKKQSQNVVFRKKTTSFSMIANPIIDDKTVSPAGGWLYVIIQRWITYNANDFICSKAFIASKFQAGSRMFERAWDELKDRGYLKMYSHPIEGWQAELLDEPEPDSPHTYYLDKAGEVHSTNIERAQKKAAKALEKMDPDHYPQNVPNGTHYPQNDTNGFDTNGNVGNVVNTINNNIDNKGVSIYPSKEESLVIEPRHVVSKRTGETDGWIDHSLIAAIKEQIDFDYLLANSSIQKEDLDAAVEAIASLKTVKDRKTFNGANYSVAFIRDRAEEINHEHVEYVFDCFYEKREKVTNIVSYLRTALFNAPATINAYYGNAVRADGVV